jgi:hypothetical protein
VCVYARVRRDYHMPVKLCATCLCEIVSDAAVYQHLPPIPHQQHEPFL